MLYMNSLFGRNDILILGKRPIKRRQRPDMIIAVDWDNTCKLQFKQNKVHEFN